MGRWLSRLSPRVPPAHASGIPSRAPRTQALTLWGNEVESLSLGIITGPCARRGVLPAPPAVPGAGAGHRALRTPRRSPHPPRPSPAPAHCLQGPWEGVLPPPPPGPGAAAGAAPIPHSCLGRDKDPVWRRGFNALPDYRQAPGRVPGSDKWGRGPGRGLPCSEQHHCT